MSESITLANRLAGVAIATATVLLAGQVMAAASEGAYAGKTEAEITMSLEQLGYEVRKVETEDGHLEAYALSEGMRFEIYVDPETGNIVKIEEDD